MFRYLFIFIVFIHGIIHFMGFAKEWNLAEISQLSGRTLLPLSGAMARAVGLLWLLAGLGFLAAAVFFLLRREGWWAVALASLVLSQLLIALYWPDAKAGTVANLIVLLVALPAYGDWSMARQGRQQVNGLLAAVPPQEGPVVTEAMLSDLPEPVGRWLRRAGIVGRPQARLVRLQQSGLMRTKPEQGWMPTQAEQLFTIDEPGFVWEANVRMMPLIYFKGIDQYGDGEGRMLIKLLSLIPVVDATGPKIDQGTMLRFLGEMIWFPSAALSPYFTWEALDANRARAIMTYRGLTASGIFEFNDGGDFVSFRCDRYYGGEESSKLEKWYIPATAWGAPGGVRIPTAGDVIWELEDGDFKYYQWEITEVAYE